MRKASLFAILLFVSGTFLLAQEHVIDSILSKKFKPTEPGTVVFAQQGDKGIYKKALGMANLELDVPMRTEMVFEIGSMTKQFTAVAILQLCEQNKLQLTDPLSKYVSDFPGGTGITIHHLLNHTSGIRDPQFREWIALYKDVSFDPLLFINNIKLDTPRVKAGEKWEYSNSGYFILGYVIEHVSGMKYEKYIQKNIFDAVGMKNSYCQVGIIHELIKNRASGYSKDQNIYNAEYSGWVQPYAAGCIMSNAEDMAKWNAALHSDKLLKPGTKAKLFENYKLNNGNKTGYGYGFLLLEINGLPSYEHGGGIPGYSSHGLYIPSKDLYVVGLSNCKQVDPAHEVAMIAMLLTGQPFTNKKYFAITEKNMRHYCGRYKHPESGVIMEIVYADSFLVAQRKGSAKKITLVPFAPGKFYVKDEFITYEFADNKTTGAAEMKQRSRFKENTLIKQ